MRMRWRIVSALFAAGTINYLDRAALGVAAPLVARDLGLDAAQMGLVFSSFFIGYAPCNLVGGWAADRFGGKRVIAVSMAGWSACCALTGAATGFGSLVAVRLLFGAGEGPLVTATNKVINTWFPRREVATALGLAFCGTPLGGALAGPVVGFVAIGYGWRPSFVVIGLLGMLWLAAWTRFADAPGDPGGASAAERDEIAAGRIDPAGAERLPLASLLRQPAVLATASAFFGYNYILFFFLTWFPSFLADERHLSLAGTSLASALPWVAGCAGLALGGVACDGLARRTGEALFARKVILSVFLSLSGGCVACAGLVTTAGGAIGLMAASVFCLYMSSSSYWAILQDTIPGRSIGTVGGFVHAIANCAGIVGPALTGFLVRETGTFASSFVLAGAIAGVGVAAVQILVPRRAAAVPSRPQSPI